MVTTLKDIAQRLSITEQAVSQALRGFPNISSETITQVRDVARELRYRPNLMARNLRRQETKAIGFILPDVTYDFSQRLLEGAKSVFSKEGYLIMIGLTSWDHDQEKKEIDLLLGYQVEALICQPIVESTDTYRKILELGLPFLFVANNLDIPNTSWIGLDNYDAGKTITEHLIAKGHSRIAFVTPDSTPLSLSLAPRVQAYQDVLRNNGIEVREDLIVYSKLGDNESVGYVVKRLMSLDSPPTAIFAVTDVIAYQVMNCLEEKGLRVPHDVAVAGIGNMAPSSFEMISLTTVTMDTYQIGQMAAKKILEQLTDEEVMPTQQKIKGDLIVRRSTSNSIV